MKPPPIDPKDYWYDLPPDRIAQHPVSPRDSSRLLVYRDGEITHTHFNKIADFIPDRALMFFNDTLVIQARLIFKTPTDAAIEVFLLEPVTPGLEALASSTGGKCVWRCMIGNSKRWKANQVLTQEGGDVHLDAARAGASGDLVAFSWHPPGVPFSEILQRFGHTPLPPYIGRDDLPDDRTRYQTIFATNPGAVAAPTAGLHFTEETLSAIRGKGIDQEFLTLHVSAGTFLPIKVRDATKHVMHREHVIVRRQTIEKLRNPGQFIVPVGTTALRTLESIYWYGAALTRDPDEPFLIPQDAPWHTGAVPETDRALDAVLAKMEREGIHTLTGSTALYIYPGYRVRFCDALVTNFHQPGSTLLLLVAAFAGTSWRHLYQEALTHGYRFLSYGDAMLISSRQDIP